VESLLFTAITPSNKLDNNEITDRIINPTTNQLFNAEILIATAMKATKVDATELMLIIDLIVSSLISYGEKANFNLSIILFDFLLTLFLSCIPTFSPII